MQIHVKNISIGNSFVRKIVLETACCKIQCLRSASRSRSLKNSMDLRNLAEIQYVSYDLDPEFFLVLYRLKLPLKGTAEPCMLVRL